MALLDEALRQVEAMHLNSTSLGKSEVGAEQDVVSSTTVQVFIGEPTFALLLVTDLLVALLYGAYLSQEVSLL